MEQPPRIYGDVRRYKATLHRQIGRANDLLDRLVGLKLMIDAEDNWLIRKVHETEWTDEVERWRATLWRSTRQHLAGQAPDLLPRTTQDWPPSTGKPRHARAISWVEPWLRESAAELSALRDRLGVSRHVATVTPPTGDFGELVSSGLVDSAVVAGLAMDMRAPRTPKQLADAIGAAKELTEATLRACLDRLGESWSDRDDLPALLKKWRKRMAAEAAPDPNSKEPIDRAMSSLGNMVTFLAEWRNSFGRGHGRSRYPSGVRPRHARLAVDAAETAIRFVVTTLDELELLPAIVDDSDRGATSGSGGQSQGRSQPLRATRR